MHDCIYYDTSGGGILAQCTTVYVLDKSWPIGTYTEIKRDTLGRVAPEGEWFISHTYRIWA